jgi:hypothetical protein
LAHWRWRPAHPASLPRPRSHLLPYAPLRCARCRRARHAAHISQLLRKSITKQKFVFPRENGEPHAELRGACCRAVLLAPTALRLGEKLASDEVREASLAYPPRSRKPTLADICCDTMAPAPAKGDGKSTSKNNPPPWRVREFGAGKPFQVCARIQRAIVVAPVFFGPHRGQSARLLAQQEAKRRGGERGRAGRRCVQRKSEWPCWVT